jgi:ATP-binding cassette, subfamily B, bacterial
LKLRDRGRQLLPFILPQGQTILQAFLCTLVFTAMWPVLSWIVGLMATLLSQGNVPGIAQLAGWTALVFLVQKLAQYGQDSMMARVALAAALDIRKQVYAHLQRLSLSYFETVQSGDLAYRLTEDVDRIGEIIYKVFHDTTPCILQILVLLASMVYLNWQLTLATLVIAPLMGVLIGWFGERMLTYSRRSQSQVSNLSAQLIEVLGGIRLVQAFAAEDYMLERFCADAERNRRLRYRAEHLKALEFPVVGFLEALAILLLLLLGGWQISVGHLKASEFVSFVASVAFLIEPISHLTSNYSEIKQAEASVERVFELLAVEPTVLEAPHAKVLPTVQGQVAFEQVSFAYHANREGKPTLVLDQVDLTIHPGEAVALVGLSGAGKTTLANLVPRFYDPQQGQVRIDGVDIRTTTLASLRRQIGIVPQETILFSGTIAQNIAFGQAKYELASVEAAAKIANAHQFITQFPEGYQTRVGERGVNLSGGQRQRLAIARAVLLDPRILILDEATSALDSESEALVQEALERLMQGRTVLIIAHRLATVRRCDRIVVMEQGQIIETGNHSQLIALGGRYAQFYARQFADPDQQFPGQGHAQALGQGLDPLGERLKPV